MPKFQLSLRKDLKNLLKRDRLIIFADKSRYMCSTSAKSYNKLNKDCLTTTYKVSDDNIIDKINHESLETISLKHFNLKDKKIIKFSKAVLLKRGSAKPFEI